ncbi:type II toxin-antitoxin system RelE/ParE family toxin [Avibacterium avium]|uniref:type II toxin-antitoxin system RelE/ParE family toxin n=1 Tax=Avibacterium avium TaxID=751 RepID=UPI003BF89072
MNEIILTDEFRLWLTKLKNPIAKATIARRIKNATKGNFGDHKPLAGANGIYEMRIATGAGYRVYYIQQGKVVYVLLCGGDKATQKNDIERAKQLFNVLQRGKNEINEY